ncbi:MAG: T9SS type A sorting domain-containing protein [Ignavibacteriaceae bacterium]
MKSIIVILMAFLLIIELKSQDALLSTAVLDIQNTTAGIYPNPNTLIRGGQEKTASGTLRILVVFVRYKDDVENTATWPDYNVLPTWAQTFVNPVIPSNGIFTPKNISDFFDRSSGGDGTGNLGSFHMIGDVVYVTTLKNENEYSLGWGGDTEVFMEVLQTLDNPSGSYNINFKLYDNWQFMRGDTLFNHFYKPGIGDGKVDHIFIINRDDSRLGVAAEKTLENVNFPSYDGVIVNGNCGSRIFGFKNSYTLNAVGGPAHEYCHYLFGGTQTTGHFDGYNYWPWQTTNRGRINSFALMIAANNGWMSAYERYRLGWLNPFIVESSNSSITLKDTHLKNEAVLIPLRYDLNGILKEFYLVENYHTVRDYARANPFLINERFGEHYFTHGLLTFHIEDQNFTLPCATKINILCADGKWTWKLLSGASTPSDRSDDVLGRDLPMRFGNFDERNFITINVGGINYNDYVCLTPRPDFLGARYNSNDWLGDFEDFFREGYNDVLTRYSNPASYLIDGTPKDIGLEIVSYNSSTKEYILNIQTSAMGVLTLKPSKPQNFRLRGTSYNHPVLVWEGNIESDIAGYNIYRSENGGEPQMIGYVPQTSGKTFTDYTANTSIPSDHYDYTIKAKDNSALLSVASDKVSVMALAPKLNLGNGELVLAEYALKQNYPNPFNPSTLINYSIKEDGFVKIKVYNILGSEIVELVNETKEIGYHSVEFNASNLPSGVYIYTLQVNEFSGSNKMLLLK